MQDLLEETLETQVQLCIKGILATLTEKYGKNTAMQIFDKLVTEVKTQHLKESRDYVN